MDNEVLARVLPWVKEVYDWRGNGKYRDRLIEEAIVYQLNSSKYMTQAQLSEVLGIAPKSISEKMRRMRKKLKRRGQLESH